MNVQHEPDPVSNGSDLRRLAIAIVLSIISGGLATGLGVVWWFGSRDAQVELRLENLDKALGEARAEAKGRDEAINKAVEKLGEFGSDNARRAIERFTEQIKVIQEEARANRQSIESIRAGLDHQQQMLLDHERSDIRRFQPRKQTEQPQP